MEHLCSVFAMRHTSFSFTLQPTAKQVQSMRRHAGAARFAWNQSLRLQRVAYAAHKVDSAVKVPYSGFDFINAFNKWKLTDAAGRDEQGRVGLAWRGEVHQGVFEEACVDLGRGEQLFFSAQKARKQGKSRRVVGFPRFKKRREEKLSFRMRNRSNCVRVTQNAIVLPKLGVMRVHESTRRLRRVLRRDERGQKARILFATVRCSAGRWYVRLNVEACGFHAGQRHVAPEHCVPVGMDLGLEHMVVCGTADGTRLACFDNAPKPLKQNLALLRRRNRSLARKKKHKEKGTKKNRIKAQRRLARTHRKIANQRRHYLHHLTSHLAKTHGHIVMEDLHVAGMVKNRKLARSIMDVSWGEFARQMQYKSSWYNGRLVFADRFFPSTKRCHLCKRVYDMPMSNRTFHCEPCNLHTHRDDNAFANLAQYAGPSDAKQVEDGKKIPGDWGGSGRASLRGETVPVRTRQGPHAMQAVA